MKTEQELFDLYQARLKPLYADLVAVTGEKSLIIDAQIESAMSHLAVSRTNGDESERQRHVSAAYNHVVRACLDAAKLFWLNRFNRVKFILDDDRVKKWCLNMPHGQFMILQAEAETAIREARRLDAMNAGHADDDVFERYVLAIQKYEQILASVDADRLDNLRKFSLRYMVKSQMIGFVLGVVASIIAAIIYDAAKPASSVTPAETPTTATQSQGR